MILLANNRHIILIEQMTVEIIVITYKYYSSILESTPLDMLEKIKSRKIKKNMLLNNFNKMYAS